MSYPLKRQWERFQKNFIVKCSLKINPWPNTCKIYKDSYMIFIVIFFSWRENSSSILFFSMRLVKRLWVSCCKASEHKGWVFPVWFRLCNGFYKDSENLKWVAWVLDVGTRVWPNQYKTMFAFSLPWSLLFYCNQFCLSCLKNIIKLIIVASSAF